MNLDDLKQFLADILMDVPIARNQSDETLLTALTNGCISIPVYPNWHSVVPAWLDEAIPLAQKINPETAQLLNSRKAVVLMRCQDLSAALELISAVLLASMEKRVCYFATINLSRILIRQQQFDKARQALDEISHYQCARSDWMNGLVEIANAEWYLEQDDSKLADAYFNKALKILPEWNIEERVQALQSLAFISSVDLDSRKSLRYFKKAGDLLETASVWSELIPMRLTQASLLLNRGKAADAIDLFEQIRHLCIEYDLEQWRSLVEVSLARASTTLESPEQARSQILEAATQCAKRTDFTGFVSMILLLVSIDIEAQNYESAYETLAVGLSISKHLNLPTARNIFRAQIQRLSQDIMGNTEFNTMVEEMLIKAKASRKE